jgi:transcriptional regulator with XRE-family HTH domain
VSKLAHAAGISYEMARRYAEGMAAPRPDKLAAIAAWLGVSPSSLAYGVDDQALAGVDEKLLAKCLTAIQEAQRRTGLQLSPEKAAFMTAAIYKEAASGSIPTASSIDLLLRVTQ